MKVYGYLRASTKGQDALRAQEELNEFVTGKGKEVEKWFVENASGATLERPVLLELLAVAEKGDCIVVEQIDRLTRLPADEWKQLRHTIENLGVSLVSKDLPTSHDILSPPKDKTEEFTKGVLVAVNGMLVDILAHTARKDYEDRRRRQAQGIAKAKEAGKFKGKQQSAETVAKCEEAMKRVNENNLSKVEAAQLAGVSKATFYRWIKENNM